MYVERIRSVLACVSNIAAFGSGSTLGDIHALTLFSPGQAEPNRARLKAHGGSGEIVLRVVQRYAVVFQPDPLQRSPFRVRPAFYHYRILDREDQEVVVYHWEPESRSQTSAPHLQVPAAGSIVLPQPMGSSQAMTKTHLSKLHLLTGHVGLEDIVELLIRDFAVEPMRRDWSDVLSASRNVSQ